MFQQSVHCAHAVDAGIHHDTPQPSPHCQDSATDANSKEPTPAPTAESMPCCLPDANQDAAAVPLDPNTTIQLGHFNLCLVEHPKLLICTITTCMHNLPILPTVKDVTTHLKTHSHAMVTSSKKALEAMLNDLKLESPATISIDMDKLPVNIIKELPVVEGSRYHCTMCSYAIKSHSAFGVHMKMVHGDAEERSKPLSAVHMQVIFENGQNCCYLHVCNKGLDDVPLPLPLTAANNPCLNTAVTAKVEAFLKQEHQAMEEAGLLDKGIQPQTFTGNISPWAKQLNWHVYWAGKPVAAIGALGPCPQDWPGAHSFLNAGCQVQQTFHATDSSPSQPYDLSDATICKHADLWSFALALLAHVCFDGDDLGYYGDDNQEEHLGLDVNLEAMLLDLKDRYNTAVNVEGFDHLTDADVLDRAATLVHQATLNLIMQQPEVYGKTEELTLVHIFLHLCLSKDGTPKPVNAATSIIVSLEFALCAILHAHLLHAEDGMLIAKPMQKITAEVEKYMKQYLHHDSSSASSHLQSLLCYGRVLSKDRV